MEDTAANLATDAATNSGEGTFTKDKAVTLTDEASIAELTAINTAKGDKTLTYTTVEDTAANLATDAATNSGEGTFTKDKAVTLTDEASIAELTAINTAKGDKTLTYTTVEDTAANSGNRCRHQQCEGTFTQDKAVNLTDEASAAELTAINTAKGDKTLTYTTVEDTASQPGNRCRHQQW